MKLALLVKEPLDLAQAELGALNRIKLAHEHFVIFSGSTYERLAYTKEVYDILKTTTEDSIVRSLNSLKFNKPICIRTYNCKVALKDIQQKKSPQGTLIKIFNIQNKVYITQLLYKNNQDFNKRRAHLMKAPHPASAHPRLARAMVNLSGAKTTITDPCCGAGGILIEAALAGLKPKGSDLDPDMIRRTKLNLKHTKTKADIKVKDALQLINTNYVVTDLPYGKSAKVDNLEQFYKAFFKTLKHKLKKRAVIGLPDSIHIEPLIKQAKLKIEQDFYIYMHKSLSRHVIVVDV